MLEQVRKLFALTQEELAERIGISQNYYTQIETGSAKSAPVISKIAATLQIDESFLMSQGEYYKYPFLNDYYFFNLNEQRIVQAYKFLMEYICAPSRHIDIVFFILRRETLRAVSPYSVVYIALRDDRETLFVLRRRSKRYALAGRRTTKDDESRSFGLVDLFRGDLHKLPSTYIYEKNLLIDQEFFEKLDREEIKKEEILSFFPDAAYFKGMYRSHSKRNK